MQGQTSPDQGEKTGVAPDFDEGADEAPTSDSPAPSTTGVEPEPERTRSRVRQTRSPRAPLGPWLRAHIWQIVAALLAILLVAAISIGAYLWDVSEKWERRSDELTALNLELADELAAEQIVALTQEQQIELLEDQRATLQSRVLDLADAVSQSGDSAATAEQQISLLTDLISTASSVTNGLTRCIDSQKQLATYMETPEDYAPEELEAFEASVEQLCAAATAANFQFQQQLTP